MSYSDLTFFLFHLIFLSEISITLVYEILCKVCFYCKTHFEPTDNGMAILKYREIIIIMKNYYLLTCFAAS